MTNEEKKVNALIEACKRADEIAQDLACMAGTTAEGRRAIALGEKLHKIVYAAIVKGAGK